MKGLLYRLFFSLMIFPMILLRKRKAMINEDINMKFYNDDSSKIQAFTTLSNFLYSLNEEFNIERQTVSFKTNQEELFDNISWERERGEKKMQVLLVSDLKKKISLKFIQNEEMIKSSRVSECKSAGCANNKMKIYIIDHNTLLITISDSGLGLVRVYEYYYDSDTSNEQMTQQWNSFKCCVIDSEFYCVGIDNVNKAFYYNNNDKEMPLTINGIQTYHSIDIIAYETNESESKKTVLICFTSSEDNPSYRTDCIKQSIENNRIDYEKIIENHQTDKVIKVELYYDTKVKVLLMGENYYEIISVDNDSPLNIYCFDNTSSPSVYKEIIEDITVIESRLYLLIMVMNNSQKSFAIKEYVACFDKNLVAIQNIERLFSANDNNHNDILIQLDNNDPETSAIVAWQNGKLLSNNKGIFYIKYWYMDKETPTEKDELYCYINLEVHEKDCVIPSSLGNCYQCSSGLYLLFPDKKCAFADECCNDISHVIDEKNKEIYLCSSNCFECAFDGYRETKCIECEFNYYIYAKRCVLSCPGNTYLYEKEHTCYDECPSPTIAMVIENQRTCINNPNIIEDPDLEKKLEAFKKKTDLEQRNELIEKSNLIITKLSITIETMKLIQEYQLYLSLFRLETVEGNKEILNKLNKELFSEGEGQGLIYLIEQNEDNLKDLLLTMSLISSNSNKFSIEDNDMIKEMMIVLCQNSKAIIDSITTKNYEDEGQVMTSTLISIILINEVFISHTYHLNQIDQSFNQSEFDCSLEYRYNKSAIINKSNICTSYLIKNTSFLINQLLQEGLFISSDINFVSININNNKENSNDNGISNSSLVINAINTLIDFNMSYANYELIELMQKHQYQAIILFPKDSLRLLTSDLTKDSFINIIQYKRMYPFLNPNITKDISDAFFEIYFSHKATNSIIEKSTMTNTPIRFIIKKPHFSFRECIYFDSNRLLFNNAKCSSINVSEYVLCTCEVIEPFSIATFNANKFNAEIVITDDRFLNPFEVLKRFSFAKAPLAYIHSVLGVIFFIGIIIAIVNDCYVDTDPIIIYVNKETQWCNSGDIEDNCVYLSMELYYNSSNASMMSNDNALTNPSKTQRRSKKNSIVRRNIRSLLTGKKSKVNPQEIVIEMEDKSSSGSYPNSNKKNNNNNKDIDLQENRHDNTNSDNNKKQIKNALLTSNEPIPRLYRNALVYCLKQEHRLISLFIWKLANYSKTITLTFLITRLFLISSICAIFTKCVPLKEKTISIEDFLSAVYSVMITEIPFTIAELFVVKKKIERQSKIEESKIILQRVIIGMIVFLILIGFSIYGAINTLCVSIVNYEQNYRCNIIEDLVIAILFDWVIFEMVLVFAKAFMIWVITRNQNKGFIKKCFVGLLAVFPWFIPSVG